MPINLGQIAAALDNDFLHLILLPTEQCNLRCTYCYERFEVGRMTRQVVDAVKGLITCRAHTLKALNVSLCMTAIAAEIRPAHVQKYHILLAWRGEVLHQTRLAGGQHIKPCNGLRK